MSLTYVYILAFLMVAVGVGFLVVIRKKSGRFLPDDVAGRLGALLSIALVVAAGLLLFVTFRVDSGQSFTRPQGPRLTDAELGSQAPDFSFTLLESGDTARLNDYSGSVVLINWWATWCAPCLEELPDLNELQAKYADRGLVVLTISDESPETLVDFERELPLQTTAGYVEGSEALPDPYRRTLQVRPTSYVIDGEGVIRDFVLGAQDLPTFERMIAPYLRDRLVDASL